MPDEKTSEELDEKPREKGEEPAANRRESIAPNPDMGRAKTALLKAYFVQSGHSEEDVHKLIGDSVQPSGVEPLFSDASPDQETPPPPPPPSPAPAPAPAPQAAPDLSPIEQRITDFQHGLADVDHRINNLLARMESLAKGQVDGETVFTQLRQGMASLQQKVERTGTTDESDVETRISERFQDSIQELSTGIGERLDGLEKRIQSAAAAPEPGGGVDPAIAEEVAKLREVTAQGRLDMEKRIRVMERTCERMSSGIDELREFAARGRNELESRIEGVEGSAAAGDAGQDLSELEKRMTKIRISVEKIKAELERHSNEPAKAPAGPSQDDIKTVVVENTAGLQERIGGLEQSIAALQQQLYQLSQRPAGPGPAPDQAQVQETLAAMRLQLEQQITDARNLLIERTSGYEGRIAGMEQQVAAAVGGGAGPEDLAKLRDEWTADLRRIVTKLGQVVTGDRKEIRSKLEEAERKLDQFSQETAPVRAAAQSVAQIWEEIAKLREDTANARMQIEERIASLRSGGMDVHTEIESTRQLLDRSQSQLNSQVTELQKTVEQLHLVMKKDKSDLAHMVDELKEEVDQARLDFGIEESSALLKSLADTMDSGSAPTLTDEQAIDEVTRTLSQFEDTP